MSDVAHLCSSALTEAAAEMRRRGSGGVREVQTTREILPAEKLEEALAPLRRHVAQLEHQIQELAGELDAVRVYIRGQVRADVAFQAMAAIDHARASGDAAARAAAESEAEKLFGASWQGRIKDILDEGRRLDAAALEAA